MKTHHRPVRHADVLELPSAPSAGVRDRAQPKKAELAALLLAAGLVLLPASGAAADLYISGGGGGGADVTGGTGGSTYAGDGGSGFGGGGGGYVGEGASSADDGQSGSSGGNGGAGKFEPSFGGSASTGNNGTPSVKGGNGGAASVSTDNNNAYSDIYISGGSGGNSSPNVAGDGGDARLTVTGILRVNNSLNLDSGNNGSGGNPGLGGKASLTAGTLSAPTINLTKSDGALTVEVGVLDVTGNNTTLSLTSNPSTDISASDVVFHNLNLGGGHTLKVDRNGSNDFGFDILNVYGKATYDDTNGLNAAGKALNFYIPESMGDGEKMLTVTGGDANITNSTVNVGIDGRSSPLKAGDSVTLIDATATTLIDAPSNTTANGQGMQGVTLKYEFELDTTTYANQLIARVTKVGANEQSKAFSEGFLSGLALVNQGVDLAADQGMDALWHEARAGAQGRGAFAVLSGGSRRYKTGSHVDVDSFSLMTGIAGDMKLAPGELTLGAFLVYGEGDYDTYNSFANAASVRGKGDSDYAGAGVLGRLDFNGANGTGTGHAYAEASLQAGSVKTDFRSNDLARYKSRSGYYGAHLGTGYVWTLTDKAQFDLYGKYLYARRDSDRVTLSAGDPLRFNAVESHRLRIGGRYSWTTNQIKPYAGLAWEHEFDGKARATAYGYPIDAPKLKGDSGVLELGLIMKPSATTPLTVNFGLQAYTGRNEGVGGNLRVEYRF
ncbi:hypothetical protein FACS1894185_2470 [Betaproteobacteria bacterium]|nr:hypothetical protein FACS1894185_2470 [Betaproteobacteria bacterium]